MLPDLLDHNLKLVFCGTAAGTRSAEVGYYYAGRGNKFWRTLQAIGLTPTVLKPSEYKRLLALGIGLTDVVKDQSGADKAINFGALGPQALRAKIETLQPKVLCFNGKRAATAFLTTKAISYGIQRERIGATRVFVAPSTSGAASGAWDLAKWRELAALVNESSA